MDDLIFSLNSTIPVFLVMVIGYILGKRGMLGEGFCKGSDRLVFRITLPSMMVIDMYDIDLASDFDGGYVLFCFLSTLISIIVLWLVAGIVMKNRSLTAEFVQGSYRSSAAVLGSAFLINIYGTTGTAAPLMILGAVPMFNAAAVVLLTIGQEERTSDGKALAKKTFTGIITNPIILGIAVGTLWNLTGLGMPVLIRKSLSTLAGLSAPLALISIGAAFEAGAALKLIKPTAVATFIKLVAMCAVFLPVAAYFGYRDQKLVALIIMLGSPATASGYVMAKAMGHRGVLAAGCIAMSTFVSAFTLTFWLWLFRMLGFIS